MTSQTGSDTEVTSFHLKLAGSGLEGRELSF